MHREDEAISREPGVTGLEHVVVRRLEAADLDSVARIDARHSGRTRREYYSRKLTEALRESGVCISLAATLGGCFAGFLLARIYYGEFGTAEPVARLDSIGVDPAFSGKRVGSAMLEQLETNLRALGVERLETEVAWDSFALLRFLKAADFAPAPVLTLEKRLSAR